MFDDYFNILLKELNKCLNTNDVPVAALLIRDNKVEFKARNVREKNKDIAGHAEIKVINKCFLRQKSKNMSEYKMVVSLQPCFMCIAAMEQSNIKEVYFYLNNKKCDYENLKTKLKMIKLENKERCKVLENMLVSFFQNLRKN